MARTRCEWSSATRAVSIRRGTSPCEIAGAVRTRGGESTCGTPPWGGCRATPDLLSSRTCAGRQVRRAHDRHTRGVRRGAGRDGAAGEHRARPWQAPLHGAVRATAVARSRDCSRYHGPAPDAARGPRQSVEKIAPCAPREPQCGRTGGRVPVARYAERSDRLPDESSGYLLRRWA